VIALITNNPPQAASNGVLSNFTLRRCVFRNVQLGRWEKPGLWAEHCVWEEGGGCDGMSGPALWLRCTFRGLVDPASSVAWNAIGGSGMALLDCDFLGTDRGPFFQATDIDATENLVSGVVCDQIAHVENGCEGIGMEGSHMINNNLIFHFRYRGEGPGIIMWDVAASGNLIRDFLLEGGDGIVLNGLIQPPVPMTGNVFQDGEIRGGRCVFGAGAFGNTVTNVGFIGPRPTRSNQFNVAAGRDPPQPVITNFDQNLVDYQPPNLGSVRFARLLDGWTETKPTP